MTSILVTLGLVQCLGKHSAICVI